MTATRFPIEAGHIMTFARAIGDPNPIYYDAEYAGDTEVGSIVAPPTFLMAAAQYDPEYRLRPRPGQPWFGSGRTPSGTAQPISSESGGEEKKRRSVRLHAEQHFEYFAPIRPGQVLTLTTFPGKTWDKQGRRGGALKFTETITEFRNQDGELAARARGVVVTTNPVDDEDGT